MLAFGLAGFRAGGRNCRVSDLGVPLGRDFLLCNENRITNRAVLAFGLAGFRAGGRNRRVSDLGVPLGRDFRLCNENLIADRAVLSLSLAGLCAGRLDCCVGDLGVTLGRDLRLCNGNRITNRAVLTFGLAGLCAGGRNCRVNDLGVAVGFALRDLTNRAGLRSCAGSILPLVTVGRDRLRLGRITDAAGDGPHAGDCAGCRGGDSAGVPGVSASLPAGLEGQVGKGEKLLSVPLFISKLVWVIPYRFTHHAGDQPDIEKLSLRGSKAAERQHVVCAGASV